MSASHTNLVAKIAVGTALVMAVISFVLGWAPFHPALLLSYLAIPIAMVSALFGVWRMSVLALYWSVAALFTVPVSRVTPLMTTDVLIFSATIGAMLTLFLVVSYTRSRYAA